MHSNDTSARRRVRVLKMDREHIDARDGSRRANSVRFHRDGVAIVFSSEFPHTQASRSRMFAVSPIDARIEFEPRQRVQKRILAAQPNNRTTRDRKRLHEHHEQPHTCQRSYSRNQSCLEQHAEAVGARELTTSVSRPAPIVSLRVFVWSPVTAVLCDWNSGCARALAQCERLVRAFCTRRCALRCCRS
jgi:hypothetical protein